MTAQGPPALRWGRRQSLARAGAVHAPSTQPRMAGAGSPNTSEQIHDGPARLRCPRCEVQPRAGAAVEAEARVRGRIPPPQGGCARGWEGGKAPPGPPSSSDRPVPPAWDVLPPAGGHCADTLGAGERMSQAPAIHSGTFCQKGGPLCPPRLRKELRVSPQNVRFPGLLSNRVKALILLEHFHI